MSATSLCTPRWLDDHNGGAVASLNPGFALLGVEEAGHPRARRPACVRAAQIPGRQVPNDRAGGPHGDPGQTGGRPRAHAGGHRGAAVRRRCRRTTLVLPLAAACGSQHVGRPDARAAASTIFGGPMPRAWWPRAWTSKVAQRRLGHAEVRMALDIYAEALEKSERRASEALAARFLPVRLDTRPPEGPDRTPVDEGGRRPNTVRRARWTCDAKSDPQREVGQPTG